MVKNKGVTLIALVITIIVLLILAGVTLSMIMGDSGIFGKANNAKELTKQSQALEDIRLIVLEAKAENNGHATLANIMDKLDKSSNTYAVTLSSKTAKLLTSDVDSKYITTVDDSTEKIYVTNVEYKCEIEITNKLVATLTNVVNNISIPEETIANINAEEVEYTPKDISWNVTNVKDALDDLNK